MKEKIDKFKSVVSRKYVVLMTDLFISSYSRTDLYKKVYFGDYYVSSAYTNGIFYYRQNAWDFGYALLERENRESFYLDKVFSNIYEVGDNLLKLSKKINQKKYYNVSWENLKNDFDFFVELYQEFALSLLGYNMQHPIEDFLRDLLERENDLEEKLSIISFPKKENIYVKEQKSLLRLGLKIDKTKKIYSAQSTSVKNEIKRHLRNYAWIYYRGGEGKILGEVDIFKQVLAIGPDYKKKINHLLYSKNKSEKKFNELCLQLKLNKKQKRIVNIGRELVYFRTYRTDYLNWTFFNILPLLRKIGGHLGLSLEQVLSSRINEISEAACVNKKTLTRRSNNYFMMNYNYNETVFTDLKKSINELFSLYIEKEVVSDSNLSGQIAFPGFLKNRICIVKSKKDFYKMKKNFILVTPMTTPDYIQIMKKASAIITDEGGITCHAAIVAREMKKPCVIGTKTATQVLHDGDLVEVDANKGIVKIIKKK